MKAVISIFILTAVRTSNPAQCISFLFYVQNFLKFVSVFTTRLYKGLNLLACHVSLISIATCVEFLFQNPDLIEFQNVLLF